MSSCSKKEKKKVIFSSRRPNDVVTIPSRPSQLPPNRRKYGGSFVINTFRKVPAKYTGKNTMFSRYNASFYLLEYKKDALDTCYQVHTNNEYLQRFEFSSDRKFPNRNFVIANFVHGIFRFLNFHKNHNEVTYLKYFNIVRRHMNEQFNALTHRRANIDPSAAINNNNNQTCTFF
jgi:hypothetical protein